MLYILFFGYFVDLLLVIVLNMLFFMFIWEFWFYLFLEYNVVCICGIFRWLLIMLIIFDSFVGILILLLIYR